MEGLRRREERERERVRERERGERGEIGEEPPSRLVSDSFCDQGDIFTYDAVHRYYTELQKPLLERFCCFLSWGKYARIS